MVSWEKGKFSYFFHVLLTQLHGFPAQKSTNFYISIIPLPLNLILFSKSPYLTAHIKINLIALIKINYQTGCIERFSENTHRYIQDHHDS